jgi:hypothetical protein
MKERKIVMLTHPTLDQMQVLGLAGMAAAYRQLAEQDHATDLSRDEWLGLMLDREAAMRADRRLTNRLAAAKLRFVDACIEDIDFASRRGLDRRNTHLDCRARLLIDVKRRGLTITPEIAVGDGALGFWKALDEVFPGTPHQRYWVHKTANVLNKVALSVQANMKKDLREIYLAPSRALAVTGMSLHVGSSQPARG